jgi:predicted AlkP superfamily phosphohydrolase/phosphomutase
VQKEVALKTLVLGFDTFAPRLAFPWAFKGTLPALGKLLKKGVWGQLGSVPDASRAAAWSSFATGLDPGKHGIFHTKSTPDFYPDLNLNADHRHGESFWRSLSDLGHRVGVVNVPMTYPTEVVEGFLIAGAEAPSPRATGFSHPADFFKRVSREVDRSYCIEADIYQYVMRGRWQKASQVLSDCLKARCEFVVKASSLEPIDILIAVFTAADVAQRFSQRHSDRPASQIQAPQDDGPTVLIQQAYRQLDQALTELVQKTSPETVIVISSHGMDLCQRKSTYLFNWLGMVGLLATMAKRPKSQYWVNRLHQSVRRVAKKRHSDNGPVLRATQVDWSKTKAYSIDTNSIYINLRGREPHGIVPEAQYEDLCQDIAEQLLATVDPLTQNPMVETVRMGRDIYDGPFAHRAPDIVLQWREDGALSSLETPEYPPALSETTPLVIDTNGPSGILVAAGSGIRKGTQIHGARITDLAPTILHLFGTGVPDHLDGQVLVDIFEEEWMALHPAMSKKQSHRNAHSAPKQIDDTALVEERLRGLGYID